MGVFLAQSHRKNTTHAVILRPLLIYLPLIYLESHLIKHLLLREPVLPFLPGILSGEALRLRRARADLANLTWCAQSPPRLSAAPSSGVLPRSGRFLSLGAALRAAYFLNVTFS